MEHLRSHQQSSLVASEAEILHTIHQHRLMGRGIGYVDAGLIAHRYHESTCTVAP